MKKLNILILTLGLLLLSSCGAEFRLVSYAQSNQVSASSVSTSFGPSIQVQPSTKFNVSVYSNPHAMFRDLDPWHFGLHHGMWTHCRYHGFHDLSAWDFSYIPGFCRPGRDFLWATRHNLLWDTYWSPHRWSLFGYDRWGYSSYYGWGWNGIYNPHQGWPYWNNNVYNSPYWRSDMERVNVRGRRGSSNIGVNQNRTIRRYDNPRGSRNLRTNEDNTIRAIKHRNFNAPIENRNSPRLNPNIRGNGNGSNINSSRGVNQNRNYYTPPPVRNNPVRTSSPTNTRSSQGQTIKRSGGRN